MRKFTKDEIKRFESGGMYESAVFDGMADPKDKEDLLLESHEDEVKGAFTGNTDHSQTKESKTMKDAFGKPVDETDETGDGKAIKEAFGVKVADEINESSDGKLMKEAFQGKRNPILDKPPTGKKEAAGDNVAIREAFGGKIPNLEEDFSPGELLVDTVTIDQITEGEGGFQFKGRAVKVDRINRNKRRYSKRITQKALKEARTSGLTLTVRDGHPVKGETAVTPVVGKVVFGDLREDGWMPYSASISNTSRGMDIQKLLRDKCIGDVSLRSKGHTAVVKEDGETFENVVSLAFRGLDLVTEGSEEGAKVDEIFNSLA